METRRRAGITSDPEYIREFTRELNEQNRDAKNRTRTFVISDNGVDRHGTIINMGAWDLDNFNQNPIVGYQHQVHGSWFGDDNPDNVLGAGKAYMEKEKKLGSVLLGDVDFEPEKINPLANKILGKVDHGTLRATSVGFIERGEGEKREAEAGTPGAEEGKKYYHFEGQELIEFSIVHIPSNPRATKRQLDELTAYLKKTYKEEELAEMFEKLGFKFNHVLDQGVDHTGGDAQLKLNLKHDNTLVEKIIKKLNL